MNYIEHIVDVKYVDGLLEHLQEWQWFFDYVGDNFEFHEPETWPSFIGNLYTLNDLAARFTKIKTICSKEWNISNDFLKDIGIVSNYNLGLSSISDCEKQVITLSGRLLLLCTWITHLLGVSNVQEGLNIRIFREFNYYQIIDLDAVNEHLEEIHEFIKDINLPGFDVAINYLDENANHIKHESCEKFKEYIHEKVNNYNAFSYSGNGENAGETWQENLIVSFLEGYLRKPNEDGLLLGYRKEDIIQAKKDLDNVDVTFTVETILLYGFHEKPSVNCVLCHCTMLADQIEKKTSLFDILNSSSGKFIKKVFKHKYQDECIKEADYIRMIRLFQKYTSPDEIRKLKKHGIPLSRAQANAYSEYCKTRYKSICNIQIIEGLRDYFEDDDVIGSIDTEFFAILSRKFDDLVETNERYLVTANAFYCYMVFLVKVNRCNSNLDKRLIHPEMIRIKNLWTRKYYEKAASELQVISHEQQVPKEEIDRFNNQLMVYPLLLANTCMPLGEEAILKAMDHASNSAFLMMFSSMILSSDFPREGNRISLEKHDIDNALITIISDIEERKGYKLLNKFPPDKFLCALYDRYRMSIRMRIAMINCEEDLYRIVKDASGVEIIEYTNNVSLAMVTQLFPILEIKIREFVSLLGLFPYKLNESEFMQCNDPSSLLRELLLQIYREQGSFENVSDLFFVYSTMYNSNFLNVRNECIHGRDYMSGGSLRYAFRLTLLCIYMIVFRIKTIEENVSDLIEVTKGDESYDRYDG